MNVLNVWGGNAFSHLLRQQRKVILKLEGSPESFAPAGSVNLDKAFNFFIMQLSFFNCIMRVIMLFYIPCSFELMFK